MDLNFLLLLKFKKAKNQFSKEAYKFLLKKGEIILRGSPRTMLVNFLSRITKKGIIKFYLEQALVMLHHNTFPPKFTNIDWTNFVFFII